MLNIEKFQFVKTGDFADGASTGQDGIYERDFGQYIVQIAISGNLMTLSYTDLSQIAARQIDVAIKYTVDTQEEFDYLIMKGRVGWLFEKAARNSTNDMLSAANLSDEILTSAFHILFGRDWKNIWTEREKAMEMRSIIRGNTQPCAPFENWLAVIKYLLYYCEQLNNYKLQQ